MKMYLYFYAIIKHFVCNENSNKEIIRYYKTVYILISKQRRTEKRRKHDNSSETTKCLHW